MKKIILALFVSAGTLMSAQALSNGEIANTFPNENIFLDASTNNNSTVNDGKGLLFPTTDLTAFTFKVASLDGINFPSAYDGMVVFNIGSGNTLTNDGVISTPVSRGFYYFDNPNKSTDVTGGRWLPLGASAKFDVTTAETTTNTLVNGNQVYAKRGQFVASGTSTAPTSYTNAVIIPTTGSLYRITIFQAGTNNVYDNSVYSYDKTTGNFITGSPSMSVVYPSGTYDYTVEYTK
ncbi:hypothetical protein SAMN05421841_0329 [Chryseobacterium wanjuense]|uniref:C1q domain-containing protein n=1 Tax=Chryseobacterium wanjuense TaxID=356305 RepID=A0A1I0N1E2_9FLAO|nr:hypothetical protein [Chryseobacterium wanjuense]SEV94842.1 hypothetical protein SAMN05421841_0329 [Chryseobacterium wanjuense]